MISENNSIIFDIAIPAAIAFIAVVYYSWRAGKDRKRLLMLGYIATRWKMRFQRYDFSGTLSTINGSYYTLLGHSHFGSSVLTGRQRAIPLTIFDYRFELGAKINRSVVKKTVFIANTKYPNPSILFLRHKNILPIDRFAHFEIMDLEHLFTSFDIPVTVRTALKKYSVYSDQIDSAQTILTQDFLLALSKLGAVDVELMGDMVICWSDQVASRYRMVQLAARIVGCGSTINKASK